MSQQFDGKVVLVTGGGSGIGQACCRAFALHGAKVSVADLNIEKALQTVRQVEIAGGTGSAVQVDVGSSAQVEAMVQHVIETHGQLDFAVNNAGIADPSDKLHEYSEEQWNALIRVDLTGVFLSMKYEIPPMLARGGGSIVNISSALGLIAIAGSPGYTAAKHGVIGLTKTAALMYAEDNIRVNAICPAYIRSTMTFPRGPDEQREEWFRGQHPVGRIGEADEVAAMAVYLCTDHAAFVTGAALPIDGGYTAQ